MDIRLHREQFSVTVQIVAFLNGICLLVGNKFSILGLNFGVETHGRRPPCSERAFNVLIAQEASDSNGKNG